MLRSISTPVGYFPTRATRRIDGRTHATRLDGDQGEVLEAARQGRGSGRDARLLLRAAAPAPAERQARDRGRRHLEETAPAADDAARAERREARHAGTPGGLAEPRGPGPRRARAEVGGPVAAP